jgi:hypothetical protein
MQLLHARKLPQIRLQFYKLWKNRKENALALTGDTYRPEVLIAKTISSSIATIATTSDTAVASVATTTSSEAPTTSSEAPTMSPKRRGRPPGSKNKPKKIK